MKIFIALALIGCALGTGTIASVITQPQQLSPIATTATEALRP